MEEDTTYNMWMSWLWFLMIFLTLLLEVFNRDSLEEAAKITVMQLCIYGQDTEWWSATEIGGPYLHAELYFLKENIPSTSLVCSFVFCPLPVSTELTLFGVVDLGPFVDMIC